VSPHMSNAVGDFNVLWRASCHPRRSEAPLIAPAVGRKSTGARGNRPFRPWRERSTDCLLGEKSAAGLENGSVGDRLHAPRRVATALEAEVEVSATT